MEVCFLVSGETAAVLEAAEFEGQPVKFLKRSLASQLGISRFRQKLFVDDGHDGARELSDDEIVASAMKIQLVISEFLPPDAGEDAKMLIAARKNDSAALEELLRSPRDPMAADDYGYTAFHEAVRCGHLEALQLLLEARAEVDGRGSTVPPVHYSAAGGYLHILRFLLELGVDKDQPTRSSGSTPLHFAACHGQLEMARFLVEEGASRDRATTDTGHTPLHLAAFHGSLEIVRFLIEAGANKDQRTTDDGYTPLHLAAEEGQLDIVRLLIESGADRGITTDDLATARDLANAKGHAEIVRFLEA